MKVQLGCFSRPWTKYALEVSMEGTAQAGFRNFGFMTAGDGQPLPPNASEDQVSKPRRLAGKVQFEELGKLHEHPLGG